MTDKNRIKQFESHFVGHGKKNCFRTEFDDFKFHKTKIILKNIVKIDRGEKRMRIREHLTLCIFRILLLHNKISCQ